MSSDLGRATGSVGKRTGRKNCVQFHTKIILYTKCFEMKSFACYMHIPQEVEASHFTAILKLRADSSISLKNVLQISFKCVHSNVPFKAFNRAEPRFYFFSLKS